MSTENKDINAENEVIQENVENTENTIVEDTLSVEEQLNIKLAEEKDKFMRLFAEFENYKKRTTRERVELYKTASEEVMLAMMPVLDDFERAIAELEKHGESDHLTGVRLISTKLSDTLASKGLEIVEVNKGDDFNSDISEAVTQIPAGDDMKGKIVDVLERGYKLGDKIIRFPKVVIGQ
ncbi:MULTISPECIES: nucleotide exchange factor GrpE [Myroides]|uniref:Protein GrpE n=1 Tax=Myroides albus TaxID=2562892 RepID=A0A6I3LRA9_9FLAO|nr:MULTISPECIES: nucleotide exchange factor GrpE [Myroides]MTG99221.1 nucleotide exchange factor GrpE [Myroides albus]MVX36189.1 nucleotide exchange factor GrpE [Myroides sp. LoEW2-1]UVD78679.1 nucleotide exchange factor GrpE [Myroides albus]